MSDEEFDAFLNDELSKDWIEGEMKIGEFTFKVRLRGVGKIPPNCNPPPEGYYLEFREKEELYEVVYTKGMQYLDKLKIKPDEYDWMGN